MTKNNVLKMAVVQIALLSGLAAYAGPQGNEKGNAPEAPAKTILEEIVSVGFAPPGMTGEFKLQIKDDGSVMSVDNKGAEKKIAKLNPEDMAPVKTAVEKLKLDAQQNNNEPPCMDAPYIQTKAYQANGTARVISIKAGCRTFSSTDSEAYVLNSLVDGLSSVKYSLESLNRANSK